MPDYTVDIRHLVKAYGATLAVDRCSFAVTRGEFFSLVGPSGAGKTSILRLIAGFERPDEGEILIEGRSMREVPPNRRPVNLVFQNYALFPHLSVFKNVAFGLEMRKLPPYEITPRVVEALEMVKLADKPDRYPHQLSGGEQQRVALARALVNRPVVVLLDEPLGALDQQLRRDMQVELKAIQEQVGLTFICVTHHQEEALTMSDRVAVMDRGRILQIGAPREIYDAPASRFVAGFIGVSNQVRGVILSAEAGLCRLKVPGLTTLAARMPIGWVPRDEAVVVLRPERLHLSTESRREPFDNSLPGTIEKAVYNGSETQYWVRVSDEMVWRVHVVNAGTDRKPFSTGERVSVYWNAGDAILLAQ